MSWDVICGDMLDVLPTLAESSVSLIVADPPYYKVKNEPWDRQWDTPAGFLDWVGRVCEAFYRVLAPNGSLYVFASPQMAARVEVTIGERFNVLNTITWAKPGQSYAEKYGPEKFRCYVPMSERIIFAEHYGADGYAKGEAGYGAKCDELRGFVFEPLRAYLASEWERAGLSRADADRATNSFMSGHYLSRVQWTLPTRDKYHQLREYANAHNHGGDYLQRPHEELRQEYEELRQEYEELRQEYEELRRPFSVTADVPYTDVWTFPTVSGYPGKHPCEKPIEMLRHIVNASSRPGDLVLDPCCGSGNTLIAANELGRNAIGVDMSTHWCDVARQRIAEAAMQPALFAEAAE